MGMTPTSGPFRLLCGASIAYGLTEGGYNAELISLTNLAKRIVAPTVEGDEFEAKRAAILTPRVIKEFLTRYDNSKIPSEQVALNVLEEMGVPRPKTKTTLDLILESAREIGFLREVKGNFYVDLASMSFSLQQDEEGPEVGSVEKSTPKFNNQDAILPSHEVLPVSASQAKPPSNRVFITHGKNKEIVAQIKELLSFGNFQPVISIEQETVSKPVPDKVMDDMRSCSASIVHVGAEMKVLDTEGQEQKILNPNVLIEIGASMALYGRRFILLVEKGVSLPSNLQGLYEVRYQGATLDYEATMKLLKAFNDFKN